MDQIKIDGKKMIDEFDEDYFISTLKLFIDETYVVNLNTLEEGYRIKDKSKIKIAAHTVKSSSGYLYCDYFANQCMRMEAIAKEGTWEDIEAFWVEFRTNFELLYNEAKRLYEEELERRKQNMKTLNQIMNDQEEIILDSKRGLTKNSFLVPTR